MNIHKCSKMTKKRIRMYQQLGFSDEEAILLGSGDNFVLEELKSENEELAEESKNFKPFSLNDFEYEDKNENVNTTDNPMMLKPKLGKMVIDENGRRTIIRNEK